MNNCKHRFSHVILKEKRNNSRDGYTREEEHIVIYCANCGLTKEEIQHKEQAKCEHTFVEEYKEKTVYNFFSKNTIEKIPYMQCSKCLFIKNHEN